MTFWYPAQRLFDSDYAECFFRFSVYFNTYFAWSAFSR